MDHLPWQDYVDWCFLGCQAADVPSGTSVDQNGDCQHTLDASKSPVKQRFGLLLLLSRSELTATPDWVPLQV